MNTDVRVIKQYPHTTQGRVLPYNRLAKGLTKL